MHAEEGGVQNECNRVPVQSCLSTFKDKKIQCSEYNRVPVQSCLRGRALLFGNQLAAQFPTLQATSQFGHK